MAVADELQSGAPVAGTPELQADLAVGAGVLAMAVLSAPGAVGLVLEASVLAWSDRVDRRPVLAAALVAMAVTSVAAACATGPIALALLLGLWGTACGIASGTAEAALIATSSNPDRAMTRWGLGANLGDLVAPLLVGGVMAAGGSWRTALVVTALLPAIDAVIVALGPPLGRSVEDDDERAPIREVLTDRHLLAWLLAAASCTLMDEILVVFGSLRMEALGHGPWARAVALAACCGGAAAGLVVVDRLLPRVGARRVLLFASALTAVSFVGWLATTGVVAGTIWLTVLGAGVAPLFPLASAAAYARRPDRPGLVGAIDTLLSPLELLAPIVVGVVADRAGIEVALLVLLVQPAVVAAVAFGGVRKAREGR